MEQPGYSRRNSERLKISDKFQGNIYLFKISNRNTRKRFEICSKLTIETPERLQANYVLV